MVGDVIFPLNRLVAVAPDVYEYQRAKYAGREAVLDYRIPGTDLLFNDTVHCAPIHPHHLYRARQAAGLTVEPRPQPPAIMSGFAYEIPLERILSHRTFWFVEDAVGERRARCRRPRRVESSSPRSAPLLPARGRHTRPCPVPERHRRAAAPLGR